MGEIKHDIDFVRQKLPHRYPFLFVDTVTKLDVENEEIEAIKNVTVNEPFFTGHFPDYPLMPGVIIIEALAQCAGILSSDLMLKLGKDPDEHVPLFLGIDNARFKKPVRPGDTLLLKAKLIQKRPTATQLVTKFEVKAEVQGELVTSAELLLAYVKK